jgi:hypothetical protein
LFCESGDLHFNKFFVQERHVCSLDHVKVITLGLTATYMKCFTIAMTGEADASIAGVQLAEEYDLTPPGVLIVCAGPKHAAWHKRCPGLDIENP